MAEKILIWAQTNNGTIANNGEIPWQEKADMKFFRQQTTQQVVVMGRNTMIAFHGHALPNRINLVLTHDKDLVVPEGFQKVYSKAEAEKIADDAGKKLAVIGGKGIYQSYLTDADVLYVTYLDTDFHGDVLMEPIDKTIWEGTSFATGSADDDNDFDYEVVKFTRR